MIQLVWFRMDMRVHDNPALFHACQQGQPVLAVTCLTQQQWQQHGLGQRKWQLLINSLHGLQQHLHDLNIPLLVLNSGDFHSSVDDVKALIQRLASSDMPVSDVNFNLEYEVNERKRDIELQRWCQQQNIGVNKFHDQCVIPPGEVVTRQQQPFKVYSPFKRAWWQQFDRYNQAPLAIPQPPVDAITPDLQDIVKELSAALPAAENDPLWNCHELAVHEQLEEFLQHRARYYADTRDFPASPGTSSLSYALSLGLISPRQCLYTAWQKNGCQLSGGKAGLASWINELIWREFYRHLLVAFPQLCKHHAFKPETEGVPWRTSAAAERDFQAWCEGKTGYPIVDAAQRQLLDTGWMHNRLRMISAMFLTKHLLIDWRRGEAFFNQHLVDADLASNNGGWQWSASTGADGAPYFRIFNPTTQSQRFDSAGEFIARYVAELATLPAKSRHQPNSLECQQNQYPTAIVEHKFARQRALDAFKQTMAEANNDAVQPSLIE
ncbi:deoxyribodipyrimidine photo-lyase [Bacterioplanes sanyensis]|uniref:Deoxyribodipyrimidine photo-lyase n=1 Tax=Bacterioplanes sanyensis TaxID=1249553 RepID=A0A222FKB7_9GAMM|nr:deoxyribodipyrimidine photo-lyase [Bacterioplanes sanyensis]ASP38673.1 deoxyribodipyrimidine photo-lyase [Bacterioplanes sanyensis]